MIGTNEECFTLRSIMPHVTELFLFLTSHNLEVKVFMNLVVDQRVAEEFK